MGEKVRNFASILTNHPPLRRPGFETEQHQKNTSIILGVPLNVTWPLQICCSSFYRTLKTIASIQLPPEKRGQEWTVDCTVSKSAAGCRTLLKFGIVDRACERSVSGAVNGAERPENRVERSGAVSGSGRKTMERSGSRSGGSRSGNGAGSGGYRIRLERWAAFSPAPLRSHALIVDALWVRRRFAIDTFSGFIFRNSGILQSKNKFRAFLARDVRV